MDHNFSWFPPLLQALGPLAFRRGAVHQSPLIRYLLAPQESITENYPFTRSR
jgi:hypothetical protein